MNTEQTARDNLHALSQNVYPGRGIVIGQTPDKAHYVQIYWIMGRSENSRNRIFEAENGNVRTRAFDEAKLVDPSLIIYYPSRTHNNMHIITNGDQTDTIFEYAQKGRSFEEALMTREFEPDAPNFTPRISGLVVRDSASTSYRLSILKALPDGGCQRNFYNYECFKGGYGHFISTYLGDGSPLPSFEGEPRLMPIENSIGDNLDMYWENLNEENRISLLVKFISAADGTHTLEIRNRYV